MFLLYENVQILWEGEPTNDYRAGRTLPNTDLLYFIYF